MCIYVCVYIYIYIYIYVIQLYIYIYIYYPHHNLHLVIICPGRRKQKRKSQKPGRPKNPDGPRNQFTILSVPRRLGADGPEERRRQHARGPEGHASGAPRRRIVAELPGAVPPGGRRRCRRPRFQHQEQAIIK